MFFVSEQYTLYENKRQKLKAFAVQLYCFKNSNYSLGPSH